MQGEVGFSEKKMPSSPCTPTTQKNFRKRGKRNGLLYSLSADFPRAAKKGA